MEGRKEVKVVGSSHPFSLPWALPADLPGPPNLDLKCLVAEQLM